MSENLGLGLRPGDAHHRAYVGPPEDYDIIAASTFGLLAVLGLRQHHTLLDIGCGSLRVGRLLIPYLNSGCYFGIEPNEWLVKDGVDYEIGESILALKKPSFVYANSARTLGDGNFLDFALAQSIFSHAGEDVIAEWLSSASRLLKRTGVLVATFCDSTADNELKGWVYPNSVTYSKSRMKQFADKAGMRFQLLDWKHPRQQWAMFSMPEFKAPWIANGQVTWNTYAAYLTKSNETILSDRSGQ